MLRRQHTASGDLHAAATPKGAGMNTAWSASKYRPAGFAARNQCRLKPI